MLHIEKHEIRRRRRCAEHAQKVGDLAAVIRGVVHSVPDGRGHLLLEASSVTKDDGDHAPNVGLSRRGDELELAV